MPFEDLASMSGMAMHRKPNDMGGSERERELLAAVRSRLSEVGRRWREVRGGIAIEFEDGEDAFFLARTVDPKWAASRENLSPEQAAREIVLEFEALDRERSAVLAGFRRLVADRSAAIRLDGTGTASLTTPGGGWTSAQTGEYLTTLLREVSPLVALWTLARNSWLTENPWKTTAGPGELERVRRILEAGLPAVELRPEDVRSARYLDPVGQIASCEDGATSSRKTPERVRAEKILAERASLPAARIDARLREILGRPIHYVNFADRRRIEFEDGMDSFDLPARRRAGLLVERYGVDGAARLVADEFLRRERERRRALRGIETVFAGRGFGRDARDEIWWFGRRAREYRFDAGRALTIGIAKSDAGSFLGKWMRQNTLENPPSPEEIERAIDAPVAVPSRALPSRDATIDEILPALASYDLEGLDRIASDRIEETKRLLLEGDPRASYPFEWRTARWFPPGFDRGWDEAEWARACWVRDPSETTAALLYSVTGDPAPLDWARARFRKLSHFAEGAVESEIFWLLRHELPWHVPWHLRPKFPPLLGSPPPDVARPLAAAARHALRAEDSRMRIKVFDALDELPPEVAREWLEPSELEAARELCLEWAASEEDFLALDMITPLSVAVAWGWKEVAERLAGNRAFAWVTVGLDDGYACPFPGLTARWLALLAPGEFAARLAAFALATGEPPREPTLRRDAPNGELHAASIAWLICRDAGVGR